MSDWPSRKVPLDAPVSWRDFLQALDIIDDIVNPSGATSTGSATVTGGAFDSTNPEAVTLTASPGTTEIPSRRDHVHPLSQGVSPIWTGDHQFSADVLPTTGYTVDLGLITRKFLQIHAAELWVETLVAQNTIATIGGRILIGPTTTLYADIDNSTTTITTKHNEMAVNDVVYMEANGNVEFMLVTAGPTGASAPYSYTVTRNFDGSGGNAWYAGDAIFNTGTTGEGFIDLYSIRGVKEATDYGPTIVGNVRDGIASAAQWTEHWAIGNLDGLYGYSSTTYGFAAGKYASNQPWVAVDATNGFRIMRYTTQMAQWDTSGNILIGQTGANQSNVYITSGGVQIRNNTTAKISLDSSGNASFEGAITASSGSITGPLTMSGASSSISIGTTPPSSATVGTGIWLDRTGLYGLAANVQQVYIQASNGLLYAGGGNAGIDTTGIWILPADTSSYFRIQQGGDTHPISKVYGFRHATDPTEDRATFAAFNRSTGASRGYLQLGSNGFSLFGASSNSYIWNVDTACVYNVSSGYHQFLVGGTQIAYVSAVGYFPGNQTTRYFTDDGSNLVMAATGGGTANLKVTGVIYPGDQTTNYFTGTTTGISVGGLTAAHLFHVYKSASGAIVTSGISNSQNTAGSSARLLLEVAGTSAGDPFIGFSIAGGAQWTMGMDNSDSDVFKISANAALGTTDVLKVDSSSNLTNTGAHYTNQLFPGNQTAHYITGGASGIGIDCTPLKAFHIATTGGVQLLLEDSDQADATAPFYYFQVSAGAMNIGQATRSSGAFGTATDIITLSGSNVGIRCTPGAGFDIAYSGTGAALRVYNSQATDPYGLLVDNTGATTADSNYIADFRVGGASKFIVLNSGLVGVNCTPSNQLHSTGAANVWAGHFTGSGTSGQSLGVVCYAGYNSSDYSCLFGSRGGTEYMSLRGDGYPKVNQAWDTTSDARLKENRLPVVDALEKVLSLSPVLFNRIDSTRPEAGFIAQEVQKVLPKAVSADKDGIYSLNYDYIWTYALRSIQELHARLTALEAQSGGNS